MASTFDHRPELAMDGDLGTSYLTYGGMGDGDDFIVILTKVETVKCPYEAYQQGNDARRS